MKNIIKIFSVFALMLMITFISIGHSEDAEAGLLGNVAKGGGIALFMRLAGPAILKGSGKRATGLALKKLSKKQGLVFNTAMGILTTTAIQNSEYKDNVLDILKRAGVLTSELSIRINEDSKEFEKVKDKLNSIATELDRQNNDNNCSSPNSSDYLLTSHKPDYTYINNKIDAGETKAYVKVGDTGAYKDLKLREKVNDKLEHDHIPSFAALYAYMKNKKHSKLKEKKSIIQSQASAVEIDLEIHEMGFTYRNKNKEKIMDKMLYNRDAKNLRYATIRDFAAHYINSGMSNWVLKSFSQVYIRNKNICLYN